MERDSIENITLEVLKQFRSEDGFQPYTVVFNETPLALVAFCTVYVILSFAFILPIGTWRQYKRQKERGFQDEDDDKSSSQEGNELVQLGRSPSVAEIENSGNALSASKDEEAKRLGIRDSIQSVNDEPENGHHGGGGGGAGTRHLSMQGWAGVGISSGEFTLLGAKQIQKEEEEAKVSEDEKLKEGKMRGHGVANGGSSSRVANGGSHSISPDFPHGSLNSRNRSQEQVSVVPSAAPSAATTSWLRNESKRTNRRSSSQASTGSSTVQKSFQSMRLVANKMGLAHQTRTVGRSQAMRRFVQAERLSQAASEEESAAASRSRDPSWTVRSAVRSASHIPRGNASDAASQVLAGEVVEGEADFYRQRFVDHSRRTRQRQLSLSLTSERSFMGALSPDVLAPEDAADANDPGRPNAFYYDPTPIRPRRRVFDPTKGPFARCSMLLDLVEPDYDMLRILKRAFPSIAGSVADPVLRLVLTAIISHFIGTTSMVAFVLVTMFLRLTVEEVAGAIVDTETTMIQMAMSEGGEAAFYLTGQYMQFALFMQILVIIPVLLIWVFLIDDMVIWLLTDTGQDVAVLASEYTKVIVTHYIVIAAGRTIMLPFNMNAPAQFEKVIDVIASICTMVTIGIVATTETNIHEKPTLVIVGWVQVVATITKTIAKISYVVAKGWFQPYQKGFFGSFTLKVSCKRRRAYFGLHLSY